MNTSILFRLGALALSGFLVFGSAHAQSEALPTACGETVDAPAAQALSRSECKARIRMANAALAQNRYDESSLQIRAQAMLQLRNYDEAILDLTTLLRKQPANAELYYQRGLAQLRAGNATPAISDFNKVLRYNPEHKNAVLARGLARMQTENYRGALPDLNRVVNMDAQCAEAYEYRAICYSELGKEEEARQQMAMAVQLNPDAAKSLRRYGLR
ncbi:tetratricopeptide repeat protein [Hymenobacter sp. BT175]|uniref:tetratricopeptide repeat protein n=1 Tax=Hymenobacter translucens TaxID=2886507 RepID=UPI001D0DC634|nr:tetratricopeptide repeat protein [Hymenobacter translucens]MCC2548092.1 tetratricopeptide repeat protein [Hymenobacter translucens]